MGKDVIIACDFAGRDQTIRFLEQFGNERPFVKIGMELFYAAGPDIVRELKARGHKVFLDLKCHDIPNTVGKTMKVLSTLGADIVNLHAAGTRAMMEAAMEGVTRPDGSRPLVIAVTQLTSTSELEAEAIHKRCGDMFLTVTPGIRFADGDVGDQVRIMTPDKARANSDYIVVGRPITAADDPVAAWRRCVREFVD